MKILIVEDDFGGRKLAQKIFESYGMCDCAADGIEGLEAFKRAHEEGKPYDLVLLDIMLPRMDGQTILREIRLWEESRGLFGTDGVKILMTTALGDNNNIMTAFREQCEGYIVKPLTTGKVQKHMNELWDSDKQTNDGS